MSDATMTGGLVPPLTRLQGTILLEALDGLYEGRGEAPEEEAYRVLLAWVHQTRHNAKVLELALAGVAALDVTHQGGDWNVTAVPLKPLPFSLDDTQEG